MAVLKTTEFILNNPWAEVLYPEFARDLPADSPKLFWTSGSEPSLSDIKIWQEIFYQPGDIGVYAAHEPFAEAYLITFNLFISEPHGIEFFSGKDAEKRAWQRIKELRLSIPLKTVQVSKTDERFLSTDLPPLE